jgi:hypothetical protein
VGALIGALIGGAATLLGTVYQQHSATASQIQAERQSSYLAFYAALDDFDRDLHAVLIEERIGVSPAKWVSAVMSADGVIQRTSNDVVLLASPRLFRIINEQERSAQSLDIQTQALLFRLSHPNLPASSGVPSLSALLTELSSGDLAFERGIGQYESAARKDLDTG